MQKQLARLEAAGVVYSRRLGRTRLYRFNPRYPFLAELQTLLARALTFYPEAERQGLLMERQRPRMAGKPL
jgi:DNA-binding transcriptional ArsR family regulator